LCNKENPNIKNYQIIGLDELENWVISERNIRSQYFPLLFGRPRFNLKLKLQSGYTLDILNPEKLHVGESSALAEKDRILSLSVMNIGKNTSYLSSFKFKVLIDNKIIYLQPSPLPKGCDPLHNPSFGEPIAPGKSEEFRVTFNMFINEFENEDYFLSEVIVFDQIDNEYSLEVSEEIRSQILNYTKT